ncbi:hypothetical protein Bca101_037397 [Brassica carinata]
MEGKEEDVRVGANKFPERQPIGTSAQSDKDYNEPPPAPLFEPAGIAEFIATFLFLYITVLTVMGVKRSPNMCASVGIQGIAWAFGGMIFALVYCTAGISAMFRTCSVWNSLYLRLVIISGGHINPAVTFGLFLARKLSLTRALYYIVMQCLGAICGAGVVKGFQPKQYQALGGGSNTVAPGYTKGSGLGAEIIGTFVLVYTVFSATDAKRNARDSHVPILAPLPIGFAVFLVHLATIPITGTGINPARSLGAAIIYNKDHSWDDHPSPSSPEAKLKQDIKSSGVSSCRGGGAGRKTVKGIDLAGGARLRAGRDDRKRDDSRRMGLLRWRESRADNEAASFHSVKDDDFD